jgi:hypothetical protein
VTASKGPPKGLSKNEPFLTAQELQIFWEKALRTVQQSPRLGSYLELEQSIAFILIGLGLDLSAENFLDAYRSAVGGEPLGWLQERIKHRNVG